MLVLSILLFGCKTLPSNTDEVAADDKPTATTAWPTFDFSAHCPLVEDAEHLLINAEQTQLSYATALPASRLVNITTFRLQSYGWQLQQDTSPGTSRLLWFTHPKRLDLLSVHILPKTNRRLHAITFRLQSAK